MNNENIKWNFTEFGKNMQIVAITTVLGIAFPFLPIVALIFLFIALGNIRKINFQLNDPHLHTFRKKYMTFFITRIIGLIILAGGIGLLVFMLFDFSFYWFGWEILYSIIPMVIGLSILIASSVIEMRSWENLKTYFENNREHFPEVIVRDAIDGSSKLRSGALMYALGFLGITLIIGFILQVVGYFKLANLYKLKDIQDYEKPGQPSLSAPKTIQEPSMEITSNFCYSCGARTSGIGVFCSECGTSLA